MRTSDKEENDLCETIGQIKRKKPREAKKERKEKTLAQKKNLDSFFEQQKDEEIQKEVEFQRDFQIDDNKLEVEVPGTDHCLLHAS